MTPELKQAAELLRRYTCFENVNAPDRFVMQQMWVLARAYLAEHPADEEEIITEEWLESIDFERVDLEGCVPYEWFKHKTCGLILWDSSYDDWIVNCFDQEGIRPNSITTRGQVRRLLAALGVKP